MEQLATSLERIRCKGRVSGGELDETSDSKITERFCIQHVSSFSYRDAEVVSILFDTKG